ncbi:hypothetical protein [Sulfurimonas sp.]|jgi:uncharacterized membrane-anchored protein YhcB (DUF1043 family)|uniref:hypothetical protein n=1 Tax=Sulfurimonas sp. TaxID=2022749 RepID=UPI0025DA3828|nr:hypothetical protein [Sulfurimonas sp.]MBT5934187.1 hypothetical protein [Sulfurimonas sp.]
MTEIEKLELEFYKNGSADAVLNRFTFSEKEEKLVRDAMRTAQLANPRMKLIRDADELLREVAKTREAIVPNEKTKVSAEDIAKLELLRLSATKKQVEEGFDNKMPTFFGFKSKYGVALVVAIAVGMMAVEYFKAKPMNDEIQRQENLMHGIR